MKTKIEKWEDGAAIKLPPAIMKAGHFVLGQTLEVRAEYGRIIVEPVQPALEELVAGITSENLPDDIEFGQPTGKELPL